MLFPTVCQHGNFIGIRAGTENVLCIDTERVVCQRSQPCQDQHTIHDKATYRHNAWMCSSSSHVHVYIDLENIVNENT